MSSYDYYIWLRALGDVVSTVLPIVILIAVVATLLVGWRWWLRSRYGDPKKVVELEKRLQGVESRLIDLEESSRSAGDQSTDVGDDT